MIGETRRKVFVKLGPKNLVIFLAACFIARTNGDCGIGILITIRVADGRIVKSRVQEDSPFSSPKITPILEILGYLSKIMKNFHVKF